MAERVNECSTSPRKGRSIQVEEKCSRMRSRSFPEEAEQMKELSPDNYLGPRHVSDDNYVADVHIQFLYRPHNVTALMTLLAVCVYYAFDFENDTRTRIFRGIYGVCFMFLLFGSISLPSGPFTRPHPVLWRLVLAVSIIYWLVCVAVLFQDYTDIRVFIGILFPELKPARLRGPLPWTEIDILDSASYGEECDITFENIWHGFDRFLVAHLIGWFFKAIMLRSYTLCMIASALWEITELFFMKMLPNLNECWWDQFILDLFIFNMIGIVAGMLYCKHLAVRQYHWRSFKQLAMTKLKLKRAAQQSKPYERTPQPWTPKRSVVRYLQVTAIIFCNQVVELNAFILKATFEIPSKHPFNVFRLFMWAFICLPSLQQSYIYLSDPSCVRLGTQSWVGLGAIITETLICIKFGFIRADAPWKLSDLIAVAPAWIATLALFTCAILFLTNTMENYLKKRRKKMQKKAA